MGGLNHLNPYNVEHLQKERAFCENDISKKKETDNYEDKTGDCLETKQTQSFDNYNYTKILQLLFSNDILVRFFPFILWFVFEISQIIC